MTVPFLIRRFPDSLLKRPTRDIDRIDASIAKLVERMVLTMRAHPRCVGLAAPQVGSDLRVAVMDASRHPKGKESRGVIVLINPQIDDREGHVIQREGCLSVPDLTANVGRSARVHISAFDQVGARCSFWLEDFEAVVAQHEVDHLDGRLFLDRVANVTTDVFRRKTYL